MHYSKAISKSFAWFNDNALHNHRFAKIAFFRLVDDQKKIRLWAIKINNHQPTNALNWNQAIRARKIKCQGEQILIINLASNMSRP